jgi:hypothetical protein
LLSVENLFIDRAPHTARRIQIVDNHRINPAAAAPP